MRLQQIECGRMCTVATVIRKEGDTKTELPSFLSFHRGYFKYNTYLLLNWDFWRPSLTPYTSSDKIQPFRPAFWGHDLSSRMLLPLNYGPDIITSSSSLLAI